MLLSATNIDPIGNNTFKHTFDADADVEIGDVKSRDFEPRLKFRKWRNECNFSIGLTESGGAVDQVSQDRIRWRKGSTECRFYRRDNPFDIPTGGYYRPRKAFEFDILLKKKPPTRRIPLSIRGKNIVLMEQRRMTLAEQWDYTLNIPKTEQPLNVGGSIAIYHASKKHGRYKTGKVAHLLSPLLTDTSGRRAIGRFQVVDDNRVLLVIPKPFYNNADWPGGVLIDPTFGHDAQGGTPASFGNGILCDFWQISDNGVGNSLKAWVKVSDAGAVNVKGNLFGPGDASVNYYTNGTTAQVGVSSTSFVLTTFAFNTAPYFTKNETYGFALFGQSYTIGKTLYFPYLSVDTTQGWLYYIESAIYNGWPSPVTWTAAQGYVGLYCDYDRLPTGEVEMTFAERQPAITPTSRMPEMAFNERQPAITPTSRMPEATFTSRKPGITFTKD